MKNEKNPEIINIIEKKMEDIINNSTLNDIIKYYYNGKESHLGNFNYIENINDKKIKELNKVDIEQINEYIAKNGEEETIESVIIKVKQRLIFEKYKESKLT